MKKIRNLFVVGLVVALSACSTSNKEKEITWAEYDHESFLVQNNLGKAVSIGTILQDIDFRAGSRSIYARDLFLKAHKRFAELGIISYDVSLDGYRPGIPHIVFQFITNFQGEDPYVDPLVQEEDWWVEGLDGEIFKYYVLVTINHKGREVFRDRINIFHRQDYGEYEFNPRSEDRDYKLLLSYKKMNDWVLDDFFKRIRDNSNFKKG